MGLYRAAQRVIEFGRADAAEQLADGHEAISGTLEAFDDGRHRFDRCEFSTVQQNDLGRGRMHEQMTFDLIGRQTTPVAAVVGPQYDRVSQVLRYLQRALRI